MKATQTPRKLASDAQQIIADVYLVGSVPADPHGVLQDLARSVSVVGRLLNGLADQYQVAGKGVASMVTTAGTLFWGIVEISVPESALFYVSRNWFKLVFALGTLIVLLGVLTNTKGMASVGFDLVVGTYLACLLSRQLHRFMKTGSVGVKTVKWTLVFVVALFAVGTAIYMVIFHSLGIANLLQGIADAIKWLGHLAQTLFVKKQ